MLNISLLALTLCGDILVQPFRIADSEPGHHQGWLRAAMAPDGHFAVAWVDYFQPLGAWRELDVYIRFFDPDGSPLTDAYKITKMVDTTWICGSHLDMDSAGNTVLLWTEYPPRNPDEALLRLQLFDTSGNPLGSHQTEYQGYMSTSDRAVGLSLNDQGEFAIAWTWDTGGVICARRYSFQGGPQGDPFVVHDDLPDGVGSHYPGVALNDAGDLVVTWLECHKSGESYPRFQVFDAENEPILGWEPMGHRVDDGEELYNGARPEVYWLDNDRFVLFWIDKAWPLHIAGRVFTDRGLTRHPICRLVHDSLWLSHGGPEGWYSTAVSPNDSFAYTHTRSYSDRPDTSDPSKLLLWEHEAGILGYIQDNEPIRWTTLFEYTPPWGADTVNSYFNNWTHVQPPAVACCDDRLVWVYSRLNTDTIFEAFAMITDWDMGVGVVESPIRTESPIRLSASLNRLSYDVPGEARLTLYSSDGRKVLEETIKGEGIWTPSSPSSPPSSLPSGVYFARVTTEGYSARTKVVVLR
ncbi:MAG: T9SS type A sorting domain-containing protein [Candidatus Stahlbacteria bacterium]|nr:MAG: T9SS type A sorting domain-containing protein [Candidatus Stahlbacteria bacterium]